MEFETAKPSLVTELDHKLYQPVLQIYLILNKKTNVCRGTNYLQPHLESFAVGGIVVTVSKQH